MPFCKGDLRAPYALACLDAWVFVGYVDEQGEEREAAYRCGPLRGSPIAPLRKSGDVTPHQWDNDGQATLACPSPLCRSIKAHL